MKTLAADALTAEEQKERPEPAHDAFQALPTDLINESLKTELTETGPYAPVGEVKGKEMERKDVEEMERKVLEEQVGRLLPGGDEGVKEYRMRYSTVFRR